MSFKYIVDNREKYIKIYFEKHYNKYPNIKYQNLILGDIIIEKDDIPIIIIERKTISDLLASIKDGRYSEQKKRILNSHIKYKIYLIENDGKYKTLNKTENKIVSSSMLSIIVQGFSVIRTESLNESIKFLKTLYNKIHDTKKNTILTYLASNDILSQVNKSNSVNINIKKKSTDKKSCFKNQLCQIPGISSVVSELVCNKYANMNELIIAFNEYPDNSDNKYKLLENLSYDKNNGKTTRIGKSKANKIYEYLY